MKDLLRTADLSVDDVELVMQMAEEAKAHPMARRKLLRNESVVLYFTKPSTRTRISFETAIARLGGTPIFVSTDDLQLGRGETIEDTTTVLSRYARVLVVRTSDHQEVRKIAAAASVPVINALTNLHHPCQSLADLFTIRQHFGSLDGVRLAYVGDGNNVANSLMEACALTGVDLAIATPPGYEPNSEVVTLAQNLAARRRSDLLVTTDPLEAVAGARVVYTDVWVSMGDPESEGQSRRSALEPYRVDAELMAKADPNAIFLHCLPAHRGEEVTAEVIDGPSSAVFDQAENRLYTAHALLVSLVRGKLKGGASGHNDGVRADDPGSAVSDRREGGQG